MKLRNAALVLLGLTLSVASSFAQDLYDNGPTNGEIDAWTINFGFAVSDSFILNGQANVSGVNFAAWLEPGDVLETAEVSITSSEFGGTSYLDQTVSFTQSGCFSNNFGFNVCTETGTFQNVTLNSGTFWLNLQNAVVNAGDPVYWDESDGPSSASHNDIGTIPSESFTIVGGPATTTTTSMTSTTGTTPEPTTIMLFGSGVLGLAAMLRRKSF